MDFHRWKKFVGNCNGINSWIIMKWKEFDERVEFNVSNAFTYTCTEWLYDVVDDNGWIWKGWNLDEFELHKIDINWHHQKFCMLHYAFKIDESIKE